MHVLVLLPDPYLGSVIIGCFKSGLSKRILMGVSFWLGKGYICSWLHCFSI